VCILAKYGYSDYLYDEEKAWYKDNEEEGKCC
jgi:hypothetical protein